MTKIDYKVGDVIELIDPCPFNTGNMVEGDVVLAEDIKKTTFGGDMVTYTNSNGEKISVYANRFKKYKAVIKAGDKVKLVKPFTDHCIEAMNTVGSVFVVRAVHGEADNEFSTIYSKCGNVNGAYINRFVKIEDEPIIAKWSDDFNPYHPCEIKPPFDKGDTVEVIHGSGDLVKGSRLKVEGLSHTGGWFAKVKNVDGYVVNKHAKRFEKVEDVKPETKPEFVAHVTNTDGEPNTVPVLSLKIPTVEETTAIQPVDLVQYPLTEPVSLLELLTAYDLMEVSNDLGYSADTIAEIITAVEKRLKD